MHISLRQLIVAAAFITPLCAQNFQRTATMRGGGNGRDGKCTIEVVVDGAADVEIRGNNAVLHNLSGQPAEWRRFECNAVMPTNPANFRFQGIDGRGRQSLMRDPRNGGSAVVRIEDPQGGREGYTFDIMWSADVYSQNRGGYRDQGQFGPPPGDRDYRGPGPDRDYRGPGPDRDYDRWHDERSGWGREQWRSRIFERVREDLDHVQSEAFSGRDMYRLGQARRELDEMQGKLAAGRYDERELDDVIAAVGNVVRDNRMSARDRDLLSDDLERLRDFRRRHEDYGAR
jgi:hypothetical protein